MKKSILSTVFSVLLTTFAWAQYCIPTFSSGTGDGDFIASVSFETINNVSGASSSPYYTNYTGMVPTPNLTLGQTYNGTVTMGTYTPVSPAFESVHGWIDFNADGDFDDINEDLGEAQTTIAGQQVGFVIAVPLTTTLGIKRVRLMTAWNSDPLNILISCGNYGFGETEDYSVNIVSGGGGATYCIPSISSGTADGDFINGVTLGTIVNTNSGSVNGPLYNDYTFLSTNIAQSSNYNLIVEAGDYTTDYYAAWIDYNHDGDFEDAGEKIGEFQSSTANQILTFNFSVPPTALQGSTRMRVRCLFNSPGMTSCISGSYGETEDYTVNITQGGGGPAPYCVANLHSFTCDVTDAIDDVYLVNSTLFNLGTGCNSLNGAGYTLWPATGSTTTTLLRNQQYTLGVTSTSNSIISAWFDWNNDGVFSTTEWYQVTTSSVANTADEITINVPISAYLGQIRMRVRTRLAGNTNGPVDPCTLFGSGETEDYVLTISSATCLAPSAIFGGQFQTANSANYYDFSANFPTSWSWNFQGGVPSTSSFQDPTNIVYNTPGCYNVTLTVTNACGSNTLTKPCYISIDQNTACDQLFISEYIEGNASNKALELYNASNNSINLSAYTVETYSNGSTTASYSLNLSGTLASHDVYVITNASATLPGIISNSDITSTVTFFDGNDAVVLKKNGVIIDQMGQVGEDPITAWIVGSGSMGEYTLVRKSTVDRPSTYWPTGQNEWDVYAQNTTTYLGSHNSTCGVGAAPIANFIGAPLNIAVGQTVNFTDLSLNSPTNWSWNFIGGSPATSNNQNPANILYTMPGCYQVSLTVSNGFGNNTKTVTCYVNVTAGATAPVANFTANVFNITTGQSVNFTDLSTNNPTGWNWTFTGAAPANSNVQNPNNVTYNTPGCFQVSLTASNAAGNNTATQTCYINVSNPGSGPLANFTTSNTSVCVGSCISFTDASTNNPTAWNWSFPGSSTPSSTSQNPSNICYNTPGTYNVSLTAINANGNNTLNLTGYITVYAIPAANAGNNQTICAGSSTQLNATGGQSYLWTPSTGLSSATVANPIATVSSNTTYTVQVTNGTCSSVASVTISVTNLTVNAGNDVTICSGATTQLDASGGTTYSWSPVLGLTNPNASNPVAFPATTTTYTVTATSNGCTATDVVTVTVASPTISAGLDMTICSGDTIMLAVNGGNNYTWSPANSLNNATISNPLAFPSTTTSYTVTGTVAGCQTSDVVLVTVNPLPAVPSISPSGIELQSSPATSYQWNLNGTPILGATFQTTFPGNPGDYTITVYNANGCSNTSAAYTITTVGVNDKAIDNSLVIYPNPAVNNAVITITTEANEQVQLLVYNSIGELLIDEQVTLTAGQNKKNINVDQFAVGVYTVKVIGKYTNSVKPLIKK